MNQLNDNYARADSVRRLALEQIDNICVEIKTWFATRPDLADWLPRLDTLKEDIQNAKEGVDGCGCPVLVTASGLWFWLVRRNVDFNDFSARSFLRIERWSDAVMIVGLQ